MPLMSVGVESKFINKFMIPWGLGSCGGTGSGILHFHHSKKREIYRMHMERLSFSYHGRSWPRKTCTPE